MTEDAIAVKRILSQLEYRIESFVGKVKDVWTEAQIAEAYGGESPRESLALLQGAEPAIFSHIEQLDDALDILSRGSNSYVKRSKADWRRRYNKLLKRGVRLGDLRYEYLQCLVCGTVYRARRDHWYQLAPRYWECPNKCNR